MTPTYRGLVCLGFMVDSYFGSAPLVDGFRYVAHMREIQGDSLLGQVQCDILDASLHSMAGDVDAFDAATASADRGWDEMRNPESRLLQGEGHAESLWRIGREAEAVAYMREIKALMDSIGETGNNATITAELATYLAESGSVEEAATCIEQARAITTPDDLGAMVPIGWAAGLVASARGEHDMAIAALDEALRTIRQTDYLNFTAETLRIRGQILWSVGRIEEAEDSFDEAAALWEHKGNVADLARMTRWRHNAVRQ
jgi:tetratricopeptide (TPR) repeat protein